MNIKEKFKQLKLWKKVVIILSVILIAIIILFLFNNWYVKNQIGKGNLVEWNGKIYTKEEINKLYPPQYVEVAAKNTPEQVYAAFRQALINDNADLALEQISSDSKDKYREIFKKYSNLKVLGIIYPEKIDKNHEYGNFSTYDFKFFKDGKEIESSIEFIKDINGYWKINNI